MNKEELSAQRAEKWREELRRSRKAKERTDERARSCLPHN